DRRRAGDPPHRPGPGAGEAGRGGAGDGDAHRPPAHLGAGAGPRAEDAGAAARHGEAVSLPGASPGGGGGSLRPARGGGGMAVGGEAPVWIRGTLDRIDRGPGGTGVLDYKSSKRRDHARGDFLVTDFQLPLYLHALRLRGEQPPLRAGWLSLRNLEFIPLEDVDGGPLEALLAMDAASRVLNGGGEPAHCRAPPPAHPPA